MNFLVVWFGLTLLLHVSAGTDIIKTIAGSSTSGSFAGDGGAATSASLYTPYGVAVDASGNVFIADTSNNRIRKVTVSTGIISTIAGTGGVVYDGDGIEATSATCNFPSDVALDSSGKIIMNIHVLCVYSIVYFIMVCLFY